MVKQNFRGFMDIFDYQPYMNFLAALSALSVLSKMKESGSDHLVDSDDKDVKEISDFMVTTAKKDILCWMMLLMHCQVHPDTVTCDILLYALPDDGISDAVLFETLWTLRVMLQRRPDLFLDTLSVLITKMSVVSESTVNIVAFYSMRLFDMGITIMENSLIQQLPAIVECLKNTILSLDTTPQEVRQQLITHIETTAASFD